MAKILWGCYLNRLEVTPVLPMKKITANSRCMCSDDIYEYQSKVGNLDFCVNIRDIGFIKERLVSDGVAIFTSFNKREVKLWRNGVIQTLLNLRMMLRTATFDEVLLNDYQCGKGGI